MSTREQAERAYLASGPGFSGGWSTLAEAEQCVKFNKVGAVYIRMDLHQAALRDAQAATWEAAEKKCLDMYELGPVRTVTVHIGWTQAWGSGVLDAADEFKALAAKAREVGNG